MDTDKKYVLFVATGVGLGHLLTAVLNSAYYAWRTGRALALDMREFHYVAGDKHAGFFEHFSLELPSDLEVITDLDVIDRLRHDEDLHFLRNDTERLNVDQPFPERVLLIPCLVPGEPYPISAKRRDAPFRVNLRDKLLGAWHEVMRRPEWSGPVVGLHYRSTVGEVTERMTKSVTPDYEERYRDVKDRYIATALQVAKDAGYTNPAFLVTSDDMEFVTYVRERLPNAFSLVTRLPDQEWAAWVRAHGHDFSIMSEAVNDLWCLSACDHLVHFRSGFSHFAILNSAKLDLSTTHYVHVPALKEILDSLGPREAVAWAYGAVRKDSIRRQHQKYLFDWLADALDRVGEAEAAAAARRRGQWHGECTTHPVIDNPEKRHQEDRERRGDLSGVLERARRAVQELPGNPFWLSGYGHSLSFILAQLGRWEEAIAPARRALEIEPEDPFLHEHLGFVLTRAGIVEEGEQEMRRAIAIDGEVGRFHAALGDCLLRQQRGGEAVEALREAVRLEPDDPFLVRRLGSALVTLRDYAAAEAAYRQALALRSEAGPHIELADCFGLQGRHDDALAEAREAVKLEPTNPHWHFRVAQWLLRIGRLEEAEIAVREAISRGPEIGGFQDLLAQILQRQGRTGEVVTTMQQAAELETQDPQRQVQLARALLESKQLAEAEVAARRAAVLRPDLVEAYDALSVIMERQSRMAEAIAAAQRSAELMPEDAGRQYRVGLIMFHAGAWNGAEQALRQAIRVAPKPPTFHNHHLMGIVLERLGRIEEAVVEARTASELTPDNADLLGRFAETLFLAKQLDEGERLARKAVSMQPDSESLKRLLANIVGHRSAQSAPAPEAVAVSAPPMEAPVQQAEQTMPVQEVAAADAPAAEVGELEPEQATMAQERTEQPPVRAPLRQWLSNTALSSPLRQLLMGKPKRGA